MALKKKYLKLAGNDFRKAWKLQKAAEGKRKKGKKKTTRKKTARKKATRKKTVRKATVKKRVTRKKSPKRTVKKTIRKKVVKRKPTKRKAVTMARRKKKTTTRRRSKPRTGNVQKIIMQGAGAAAGAIGAGVVANMVPLPDPRIKAALPIAGGIAIAMSGLGKQELVKFASIGMISAGALALVKQFAPNIPLLAGEDEGLLDYVPESYEEQALLGENVDLEGENFDLMGYDEDEEDELDIMDGEFLTTADL